MAQRLIAYRGRPLAARGRPLLTPLPVIPSLSIRETLAFGDMASALADLDITAEQAIVLGDGVSANPPSALVPSSLSFSDAAAVPAITFRATATQALSLTDGAAATVEAAHTTTNNGPYPKLILDPAFTPAPEYDAAGKSYITVPAGTGEWNGLFTFAWDAGGPAITSQFIYTNPGSTFVLFGQDTVGVGGGHSIGAAGTVYEFELFVALDNGSDAIRGVRITAA